MRFPLQGTQRTLCFFAATVSVIVSGCWMGGGSRATFQPPAHHHGSPLSPTPDPGFQSPAPDPGFQPLGPSAPFPENAPTGPTLEGPTFPSSSTGNGPNRNGFNRPRFSGADAVDRPPASAPNPSQPLPQDGPIAAGHEAPHPQSSGPRFGYVELPPSP